MNQPKNDIVAMYRHPLGGTVRSKRRGYSTINFNDRSPEYGALTSHVRATAYRARKERDSSESSGLRRSYRPAEGARGLLELGREYDAQARDNFTREAILFCIIVLAAVVWPVIQSLRAMIGS